MLFAKWLLGNREAVSSLKVEAPVYQIKRTEQLGRSAIDCPHVQVKKARKRKNITAMAERLVHQLACALRFPPCSNNCNRERMYKCNSVPSSEVSFV